VVELLRLGGQQRSLSFSLTCLVAMAGQLLLATSAWAAVLVGVLLSGMANGAVWTIIPIVMADLYGLENLGANYKVTCIGEAVGYLAISRGLAAHLYQQAIGNQQQQSTSSSGSDADDHGTTTTCLGSQCFRETFLICAGLCLVATLAGIWLGHRTSARDKELRQQQKEERVN
jgi:MFS family permease